MGIYLNPKNMTKEAWLEQNAKRIIPGRLALGDFPEMWEKNERVVVLVDNGYFTAAAVAYSHDELRTFLNVRDKRPKTCFVLDLEKFAEPSLGMSDGERQVIKTGRMV